MFSGIPQNFLKIRNCQNFEKILASWTKIEKGQFFITIEEGYEVMQTAWQHIQPRNLTTSRPRGWIRSNTNIGPVLDVKPYPHDGRYCIDIMTESLFWDHRASWIRIMNDINKYVIEASEEIQSKKNGSVLQFTTMKSVMFQVLEEVDGYWPTTVRSLLFRSVTIDDQSTVTWILNSPRRRWISKIWRIYLENNGRICQYFAMISQNMEEFSDTGRRKGKDISIPLDFLFLE